MSLCDIECPRCHYMIADKIESKKSGRMYRAVTISGWTTGASNEITIKTENDRGAWSTDRYRLHTSNIESYTCMRCSHVFKRAREQ